MHPPLSISSSKILLILIVYLLARLGQSFLPLIESNTLASARYPNTNLVALLVDSTIYNSSAKSSIERYAQQYIQSRLSDTKAIIFPINTTDSKAQDMVKLLENLYYHGVDQQASTLQGVILIGNIPIPEVCPAQQGVNCFRSVFPYTDFDDAKYYRDPQSSGFIGNNNPKAQADIRHGVINFGSTANDYISFFLKLRDYAADPRGYIGTAIWYEDFIDQKESFNNTAFPYYVNNFLFAEDIAYHRYNPLLVDIYNNLHNANINALTQKISNLTGESGSYANQVGTSFSQMLNGYNSTPKNSASQTPTVFVDDALQGFMKSYDDLYGVQSRLRMRDNILSAGRRSTDDIDSHYNKIIRYDSLYSKTLGTNQVPLLVELNKAFENKLIKEVKNNNYALHVAIPVYGQIEKNSIYFQRGQSDQNLISQAATLLSNTPYYEDGVYEAFYYGRNTSEVTGLQQTSLFLGTPNRLENNATAIATTSGASSYKSIGASHNILSAFVEANRGFNTDNAQSDIDTFLNFTASDTSDDKCNGNSGTYVDARRGGNTPINLSGYDYGLDLKYKRYDRAGTSNRLANNFQLLLPPQLPEQIGKLFDIAGSREVQQVSGRMAPENMQGGFLQRVARKTLIWFPAPTRVRESLNQCDTASRYSEPLSAHDIMNISGVDTVGYYKNFTIQTPSGLQPLIDEGIPCPSNPSSGSLCFPDTNKPAVTSGQYLQKHYLTYKTIDSTIIHNSPNSEQISGFSMTTASRPIDSTRYITFRGINGQQAELTFPNLYEVEVYKNGANSGELLLKTPHEIKQSLILYLQSLVDTYNTKLTSQLNGSSAYFNTNPSLFAKLGQADSLATPARNYSLLDRNMFVDQVSSGYIDAVAQILYTTNRILPRKGVANTIKEELDQSFALSSITTKKQTILNEFLSKKTNVNPLAFPGYKEEGYEVIAFVSDSKDDIVQDDTPEVIKAGELRQEELQKKLAIIDSTANAAQDEGRKKDICTGPYGEPVPLFDLSDLFDPKFPWIDALGCWLENIKVPKLTIDFRNNQGNIAGEENGRTVLVPDFMRDLRDTFDNTPEYQIPENLFESASGSNNNQQSILDNFDASLSSQAYLLDTSTPEELQPQLILDYHGDTSVSTTDLPSLRVTISSTGKDCILIDGNNTCTTPSIAILPGYDKKILTLTPSQHTAGMTSLKLRICTLASSACINKTLPIIITAGPLHTSTIISPSTTFLVGTPIPLQLQAKDFYNNTIKRSLSPYFVTVSGGNINSNERIQINEFGSNLFVNASNQSGESYANVTLNNRSGDSLASQQFHFVPGLLSIQALSGATGSRNSQTNTLNYTLPQDKSTRYTNQGGRSIFLSNNVPKVQINLRDNNNNPLAGPISMTVEQGLVELGTIRRDIDTIVSGADISSIVTSYFDKSNNLIVDTNGRATLALLPIGKAGTDTITLSLPDGTKKIFTVVIGTSYPAQVIITGSSSESITANTEPSSLVNLTISVQDSRGNTIQTPGIVRVSTLGSLSLTGVSGNTNQHNLIITSGSQSVTISTDSIGGPGHLIATMIDDAIVPATRSTNVQQSIIPQTGLNGMYLSLLGSDRGEIDSGTNQAKVSRLLTNSPKLLAITTQIYSDAGSLLGASSSPEQQVGRRNKQHHLTQFGQGKSVGEATFVNADDTLINFGDPLVMRVSNNTKLADIEFDEGPGQLVVSNSSKSIIKSFSADINGDKLEDIVTVFGDGSVTRQKNYGGDKGFVDMGPLLKIFNTIGNVYRSDTAGDGFDDIIVQLSDGSLRTYTNTESIFDVDGYPLCLSGAESDRPDNILSFDQRFIEDMDQDGSDDIITHNQGDVTIIYGKQTTAGHSYISKNRESCDQSRPNRQVGHINTVTTFTTQIASGMQIVDDSLIRWAGLSTTSQGATTSTDDTIAPGTDTTTLTDQEVEQQSGPFGPLGDLLGMIKSIFGGAGSSSSPDLGSMGNFPVAEVINNASDNLLRRSTSPTEYQPIYEQSLSGVDLRYIAIPHLDTDDQVKVYKTFKDLNGAVLRPEDIVEVTVRIEGLKNDPLTYIDHINGPWKLSFEENKIQDRNEGTLNSDHQYVEITPQDGYSFIVDNIRLGSANSVSFSYRISFQGGSASKIKISDRNNDIYPDISLYPLDGCSKFFWVLENSRSLLQSYKSYGKRFVDIGAKLEEYSASLESNTQNFLSSMSSQVQNASGANGSGAVSQILNGLGSEQMDFGQFFGSAFSEGGSSINIDANLVGGRTKEIDKGIKDILSKICGGGGGGDDGGSCNKGLPVPFNMSFLTPGEFNIFGCRIPDQGQVVNDIYPADNGFPAFWFPGTQQIGPYRVPFPWGIMKVGGTDEFGYFGFPTQGGNYPSQLRIYLSPTLTMQMGVAICYGPQAGGSNIPKPFNNMGGNCFVTKIPLPEASCEGNDTGEEILSEEDLADLTEFGQCAKPPIRPTNSTSPTQRSDSPLRLVNVQNGTVRDPFPSGTYFGIVNIEKTPIVQNEPKPSDDEGDYLQGGQEVTPQLQGGMPAAKGLVKCIVNDRMDRQMNYMINNLTNMQIGIYLPDLSQLGQGFENIGKQTGSEKEATFTGGDINNQDDLFTGKAAFKIRNATINQSSLNQLSDGINNPFDQISKLFEQTPLIRINTTDVQVKVPFLYAEDIARYESYLKSRGERNKTTVGDREALLQGALGLCGKQYRVNVRTGGQVSGVNFDANQVLDDNFFKSLYTKLSSEDASIKQNMQTLEACKEAEYSSENSSCQQMASDFETSPSNANQVEKNLESQLNRSNSCFSFFFKGQPGQGFQLNPSIKSLVSISVQGEKLQTSIRANIKVLDQYKKFPLQLYQWTHIVDRYLGEIVSSVDNFLGAINLWLSTNASRFEQYVDAIITISTALQSRQAILDLSTTRQKKCSTCAVDNYDSYACQLGFLCNAIKIPILKLPPFKIPNITLDFSHIDLGMEILLPKFQFVPTSVPLPQIPDLPQAPNILLPSDLAQVGINWLVKETELNKVIEDLIKQLTNGLQINIPSDLSELPILPQPPVLPELPSFIPNIKLELPNLPPAPSIPNLSPEFETVLDVAGFVSELYCIVKSGIGLVGEKGIKARVEQLTQRKYKTPFFDDINLSRDMSYQQDELVGFDYKIDAFVNFNYNFSYVYDLIQGLANEVNKQTDKLLNRSEEAVKIGEIEVQIGGFSGSINEGVDEINNTTQQNIDLSQPLGQKENLNKVLSFLANHEDTPRDKKEELLGLQSRLNEQNRIVASIEQLNKVKDEQSEIIKKEYESIKDLRKNFSDYKQYDAFLDSLVQNTEQEEDKEITLSINLLSGDKETLLSHNSTSLRNDYLQVQNNLLTNYRKGLEGVQSNEERPYAQKIIKEITYLQSGITLITQETKNDDSLDNTSVNRINNLYKKHSVYNTLQYRTQALACTEVERNGYAEQTIAQGNTTTSVSNYYPYPAATAQAGGSSSPNPGITDISQLLDFTQDNKGVKLELNSNSGTTYKTIVSSKYFVDSNQGIEQVDLTHDGTDDIILRDNNNVWVKYGKQDTQSRVATTTYSTKLYIAPTYQNSGQWESLADDDGLLSIGDTVLKVSSKDFSVKNLAVEAQDYDSFTVSWSNSLRQQENIAGYLLEVSTLPDLYHLKAYSAIPDRFKSQYVLMIPQGTLSGGRIMVPEQLSIKDISDYMTGTIIDVQEYNPSNKKLRYVLNEIPRSWYYTRVVSLENRGSDTNPIYTPSAPRSHHIVAGQQIMADTNGPEVEVSLKRNRTSSIVDTGLSPKGLVNTDYDILLSRNDVNGVKDNWIENMSGQIIALSSGGTNKISHIYKDRVETQQYRIFARDHRDNTSTEIIDLAIDAPRITIDSIETQADESKKVISSLEQGMDDGIIKYEKRRNNTWTPLAVTMPTVFNYPLGLDQVIISGGLYNDSPLINFYLPNPVSPASGDILLATLNKLNGKIMIEPGFSPRVAPRIDLTSNRPIIVLTDTQTNNKLFTISLKSSQLHLTPLGGYQVINLVGEEYGSFAGGSCLREGNGSCVITITPDNYIIIQDPYHTRIQGSYKYNDTSQETTIDFIDPYEGVIGSVRFIGTF